MSKPLLVAVIVLLAPAYARADPWQPSPGHTQIPLWPATAASTTAESMKQSDSPVAGKPWLSVANVSQPTITVYSPTGKNTGAAVLVFPGGGYKILAIDLEGTEVCDWLTTRGITCIVLKYRVPDSGMHWYPDCNCQRAPRTPMALQDAQRAMGLIRSRAAEWKIDPKKVGVLGFSAGGHLSADLSTHFDRRAYTPIDAADRQSCRPDFAVILYPGHLWIDEHKLELNPAITVTKQTPPTFIVQAENDDVDPVEHSLVYYLALKRAGVPVEMHLYADGGHAFGLRPTQRAITKWPQLVEPWLATIGMLPP